jgi:cytochrome c oxidase cbb3-type subunit 3
MLAWRDQLSPQQIDSVVAFVWSLHGSNPPNPKAPQGLVVVRP